MIYIASDHAGFKLKEKIKKYLIRNNYDFKNLGAYKYDKKDDYPDYARKVCESILNKKGIGILVCGTGQGMCITANKFKKIIAALAWDVKTARHAKEHLNADILCLPGYLKDYEKVLDAFLKSKFRKAERHKRRLKKIKKI